MTNITKLIQDVTSASVAFVKGGNASRPNLRENNILDSFHAESELLRPFKELPNVSELWMRPSRLDPLLEEHGVARKIPPEMGYKPASWKIKAANRYLRIMYYRLEKVVRGPNPQHFWVLALTLMRKSVVLKSIALRKLDRNWHRNIKLATVKLLLKKLGKSIETLKRDLDIVRQYEDKVKPDGSMTYRPVGSPAYVDRMYLYLWQSFMVMFVGNWIDRSQHAYRPKKGVVTASAEIAEILSDPAYTYAWEFDLKGAFPSVNIPWCMETMTAFGLPKAVSEYIEAMSVRTVERVDLAPIELQKVIPEPKFEKQELLANAIPMFAPGEYDWIESQLLHAGIDWFRERARILGEIQDPIMKAHRAWAMVIMDESTIDETGGEPRGVVTVEGGYGYRAQRRYVKAMERAMDTNTPIAMPKYTHEDFPALVAYRKLVWDRQQEELKKAAFLRERAAQDRENHAAMLKAKGAQAIEICGFPQGSGLSPILFNVAFEAAVLRGYLKSLDPSIRVVSYADDFLVFSKVEIKDIFAKAEESEEMRAGGLKVNTDKSRAIKVDGKWIVDRFKFLGLEYITGGPEIAIKGAPRSGRTLMFDKMDMVEDYVFRDKQLREAARVITPNTNTTSQDVLEGWSRGELPWTLIPYDVMVGKAELLPSALISIRKAADNYADMELIGPVPKGGITELANWNASETDLVEKFVSGKPLTSLGTRLAGLLVNRLHGGEWSPMAETADRSLKSNPLRMGRT